jgi:ribosome maturation protein SDO1
VNYRQGLETDLSEVLQTDRVFTNVSRGQFANGADLKMAFGDDVNEEGVCRIILDKGQIQVSDLERSAALEQTIREIVDMICQKCISQKTQRPFTPHQIRQAMKAAEFRVNPTRSIKQQFLDVVKLLQEKKVLDIERAKMKLAIVIPTAQQTSVQEKLDVFDLYQMSVVHHENGEQTRIQFLSDPSVYRQMDQIAKEAGGQLEISQQVVISNGNVEVSDTNVSVAGATSTGESMYESDALDKDIDELTEQVKSTKINSLKDGSDSEEETEALSMGNRKKQAKKAQKQSKKARRREKEETAERQARIDAEKLRQEERFEKMSRDSSDTRTEASDTAASSAETKSCNTCGGSFSATQYRAHFRSDWHRYNMKLKLTGVPPVSEEEFRLCDEGAFFDTM